MSLIPAAMKGYIIDRALDVLDVAVKGGLVAVAAGIATGVHGALANAVTTGTSLAVTSTTPPPKELGISPVNLSNTTTSRGTHAYS